MENATMTMTREAFNGLVSCNKNKVLDTIYRDWKMAIEMAVEYRLDRFSEILEEGEHERLTECMRRHMRKADTLRTTMVSLLAYNKAGDLDDKRMDDAFQIMGATEDKIEKEATEAYWKRKEREKEEALKAEYMAGFDAWKATKVSA